MLLYYLIVMNVLAFLLFYTDKRKAQKDKWRIKESTLLIVAALGGSYGALVAMYLFHHKTRKPKFYILVPLMTGVHVFLIHYIRFFL